MCSVDAGFPKKNKVNKHLESGAKMSMLTDNLISVYSSLLIISVIGDITR